MLFSGIPLSKYGVNMTRGEIKDVILEIIADIDEDADMDGLNPDEPDSGRGLS